MANEHDRDVPLDLSALDPAHGRASDFAVTADVMRRVRAEPSEPASRIDGFWGLWSIHREVMAAGIVVLLLMLAYMQPWQTAPQARPATVAESIGIPPEFVELLAQTGGRP